MAVYTLVSHSVRRGRPEIDVWTSRWADFDSAADTAAYILETYPGDIFTVVELETGVCRHCRRDIEEVVGWVTHKWKHVASKSYGCWPPVGETTQAEPM